MKSEVLLTPSSEPLFAEGRIEAENFLNQNNKRSNKKATAALRGASEQGDETERPVYRSNGWDDYKPVPLTEFFLVIGHHRPPQKPRAQDINFCGHPATRTRFLLPTDA